MESTSFRCTRCQELGSHLSKDCSKSCPALKDKNQHLFHQKQQKFHADVLISRQKHQLDEIISLKEQVSEIAHLKSEFLALKTELAEVKERNTRSEKKLSELITYSIFHIKNTKAQEEICFIVRREASEQTTDAHLPILQHHQPW